MTHHRRRFEMLLPLRRGDGTEVPRLEMAEVWRELEYRVGGPRVETEVVRGLHRETGGTVETGVRLTVETRESAEILALVFKMKKELEEKWGTGVGVVTYMVGTL